MMRTLIIAAGVCVVFAAWIIFGPLDASRGRQTSVHPHLAIRPPETNTRAPRAAGPESGCVYEIVQDGVRIPFWDDRPASAPAEIRRFLPSEFEKPAHVYRDRVIVQSGAVSTVPFAMPESASELVFAGRGRPVEEVFPRIRISVVPTGTNAAGEDVYTGYVLSRSQQRIVCPIPNRFHGKTVRIEVSHLNPAPGSIPRPLWIAYVAVR